MTAAVFRNTPSLSVPQSQNTAQVLEFDCLYTHDVRKKAKKWQDGFLRYHTFNKRIMVYDVPRNFIGDTHWTNDDSVAEGDEITLKDGTIKVEVGDSKGQTETDLSELRTSRKKPAQPNTWTPARRAQTPALQPAGSSNIAPRAPSQLKHRSLNALLGTPKGPIGKATLPQKSPFEERYQEAENQEWEDGRPPKRARTEESPGWNITRTTKTPQAAKPKASTSNASLKKPTKQRKSVSQQQGQQRLGTKEIIDLSDDVPPPDDFLPGFSSDALRPSSPAREKPKSAQKPPARSSSPAFQTQQAQAPCRREDRPAVRQSKSIIKTMPRQGENVDKERISRTTTGPTDSSERADHSRCESRSRPLSPAQVQTATNKPAPVLRLAASAPKKRTLLCQDQLTKQAKGSSSSNSQLVQPLHSELGIDSQQERANSKARQRLEARLARIDQKRGSTSSSKITARKSQAIYLESDSDTEGHEEVIPNGNGNTDVARPRTSYEASAIELGRLDEMMLPPARTEAAPGSPKSRMPDASLMQDRQSHPHRPTVSNVDTTKQKPKRVPGAPVRYTPTPTPSPTKRSREPTPVVNAPKPNAQAGNAVQRLPRQSKQKQPLQKSVSLNVTSGGTSQVILSKPFQQHSKAPKPKEPDLPKDIGPWSREAFDLFTWRPPNWDEEKWRVKASVGGAAASADTTATATPPPAGPSGGVSLPRT